jgi:hypothetical protein
MHRLDPVEVRARYTGTWAPGFEIADETYEGYRVRRVSDGVVLPGHFHADEVRWAEPLDGDHVGRYAAAASQPLHAPGRGMRSVPRGG